MNAFISLFFMNIFHWAYFLFLSPDKKKVFSDFFSSVLSRTSFFSDVIRRRMVPSFATIVSSYFFSFPPIVCVCLFFSLLHFPPFHWPWHPIAHFFYINSPANRPCLPEKRKVHEAATSAGDDASVHWSRRTGGNVAKARIEEWIAGGSVIVVFVLGLGLWPGRSMTLIRS